MNSSAREALFISLRKCKERENFLSPNPSPLAERGDIACDVGEREVG